MNSQPSTSCPFSPTSIHRVYYSARRQGITEAVRQVAACCRDCGMDVFLLDGRWILPPPGEIVVGLMAEFQARMIEGEPNRIGEPRGIFGAACRSDSPGLSAEELIQLADMFGPRRVTFEQPSRPVSFSFSMKPLRDVPIS